MRQFRLVHIGVSAAMAAAAVSAIGLVHEVRATGPGAASVLVPITPCRLLDTRSGTNNVGARNSALQATETATFAVWGTNGNCTIPTSATGVAANATAVNPTAASYVTIFPADANPRPVASNLNVVAGGPATPNQVTVGLSAAGAISIYNNAGTVDLIVDIVGYYQAASPGGVVNNDDRYYTKAEVDAAVATKQTRLTGTQTVVFASSGFRPETSGIGYSSGPEFLTAFGGGGCFLAGITLPNGATVTRLAGLVYDNDGTAEATVALVYTPASASVRVPMASFGSGVATVPGTTAGGTNTVVNAVVNTATRGYSLEFCGGSSMVSLDDVAITYTLQ